MVYMKEGTFIILSEIPCVGVQKLIKCSQMHFGGALILHVKCVKALHAPRCIHKMQLVLSA